jgi:tetratricopeptide (TPR) repeat protein
VIAISVIVLVSVNYLAYKNALKQAWKDGKMSADESAMLDTLRKSLNISPEEHLKIEKDVRIELSDGSELPDITEQSPNGGEGAPPGPDTAIEPPAPESQVPEPPATEEPAPTQKEPPAPEPAAGDETETNDIKGLLTAGKNSYHKGNYEEAIEYCDKVLLLDPDNSEALFFRKRTLSKIEKLTGKKGSEKEKAEAKAETAVEPKETPGEVGEPAAAGTFVGDPNCKSCKGTGQCHWCKSSGQCYWCKGSGKCDKCGGTGKMGDEQCKSCKGTGKCHSCNGDGKCYWCGGGGRCSKCSK